jgi:hypothetical protein
MYPSFSIIDESIHTEMQKLNYLERSILLNFIANVGVISREHISHSIACTSCNQLIEVKNIRINNIDDYQLYEMIVRTYVNVVFNGERDLYQNSLIQICLRDKLNFNRLIDTYSDLSYVNIPENYCEIDLDYDDSDYYDNYSNCNYDNYDEGYDSVG